MLRQKVLNNVIKSKLAFPRENFIVPLWHFSEEKYLRSLTNNYKRTKIIGVNDEKNVVCRS